MLQEAIYPSAHPGENESFFFQVQGTAFAFAAPHTQLDPEKGEGLDSRENQENNVPAPSGNIWSTQPINRI